MICHRSTASEVITIKNTRWWHHMYKWMKEYYSDKGIEKDRSWCNIKPFTYMNMNISPFIIYHKRRMLWMRSALTQQSSIQPPTSHHPHVRYSMHHHQSSHLSTQWNQSASTSPHVPPSTSSNSYHPSNFYTRHEYVWPICRSDWLPPALGY